MWLNPFLYLAYKKHENRIKKGINSPLNLSDIFDLAPQDEIVPVFEQFDYYWNLEKKQPKYDF